MNQHVVRPSAGINDRIAAFERVRQELNRVKRVRTVAWTGLFLLGVAGSVWLSEVNLGKLVGGFPGLVSYIHGTLPLIRAGYFIADLAEWYWGLGRWLSLLLETLLIAFMGALFGTVGAFFLCFPASRNLASHGWLYVICRRALEVTRTVPEVVFALIFVYAFGLGPLPGVLAIAVHSMGALGKLFSEVNDNIDLGPVEGVRAAGGNWGQIVRYAVVPQVLPNFISYTLLRFEINVRASSVIGFVGAGGIGQELYTVIRQFIYVDISALVLLLLITVAAIDMICEHLRYRFIGERAPI
jgi:phosphonate transport system permease protein